MELLRDFKHISKKDVNLAGGKGASLGEMTKAGISVPSGFVILSTTFDRFLRETDLNVEVDSIFHGVNHKEIHTIDKASKEIEALILGAEMPKDIQGEVRSEFKKLGAKYVAVRSSATAEDSSSAAWAGQLDSYLNTTEDSLLENVKKCWASFFTPRAIFYRFDKELHKQQISVAVVVQKMVESEVSGIAFSVHPVTEDCNQLIIEAGLGLGEAIVSGSTTPDSYVVEKNPMRIIDVNVSGQEKGLYRVPAGGNEWKNVAEEGKKQKLSEKEILALSKLVMHIEDHYGFPVDIEWAYESGKFYIVQARPITTLKKTHGITLKDGDKIVRKDDERIEYISKWLKEGNWEFTIARKANPFNFYLAAFGNVMLHKIVQSRQPPYGCNFKITDMPFWYADTMFQNSDHIRNLNEFLTLHLESEKGRRFLNDLMNYFEEIVNDLDQYIDKNIVPVCHNENYQFNAEKYKEIFLGFYHRFIECAGVFRIFLSWSDELEKRLKTSLGYSEEMFRNAVLIPVKKPYILTFRNEARQVISAIPLEIIAKIKEGALAEDKKIENLLRSSDQEIFLKIKNLMEKYEWIMTLHYVGKPLGLRDILDVASQNQISQPATLNLEKLPLKSKTEIKLLQYLIYLRTRVPEVLSMKGVFYLRILYQRVAQYFDISYEEASVIFPVELEQVFKEGVSPKLKEELQIRKNGFDTFIIGGKIITVAGDARRQLHEIVPVVTLQEPIHQKEDGIISGKIGHDGYVKGIVRVILGPDDFHKVKDGDILVAGSTTPNYFPVMCRAAAFITDEGGVTAHAAIIARELKRPCIIGTKIATQVLKDGDLVEVDANKGVVRILKQ